MIRTVLIVGLGEIGRPLYYIIKGKNRYDVYGYDLDVSKPEVSKKIPKSVDVVHICIPCTDMANFVKVVVKYFRKYNPKTLIIHSTVPPRTTDFIADVLQSDAFVAHSPMFGIHKNPEYMIREFKFYPHIIGGVDEISGKVVNEYFNRLGFKTLVVKSSLESEIMKIMETTYAGWLITFFVEFHRLSQFFGANYEDIIKSMKAICEKTNNKPIWYPNIIGGHCIMQNIELLLQCYDSGFLHLIQESNELRKEEINDEVIKKCVEKLKKLKTPQK